MTNERLIELARQLGKGISFADACELSEAVGNDIQRNPLYGRELKENTIRELCNRLEAVIAPDEIEDDYKTHPKDCLCDRCVCIIHGEVYLRDGKTLAPKADAPLTKH
jgi:hypothetical protein